MSARIQFDKNDVYQRYFVKLETADIIAKHYLCSNVTVLNFIRRMNWAVRDIASAQRTTRQDEYSPKKIKLYRTLYESGTTFDELGRQFRIDPKRLSRISKDEGWFIPRGVWIATKAKTRISQRLEYRLATYGCSKLTVNDYRSLVNSLTTAVMRFYAIPRTRATNRHLDHIYPVVRAFYGMDGGSRPCSIFELCHPVNLRFLPATKNIQKGASLEISLAELRRRIRGFNVEYGDPWENAEKLRQFKLAIGSKDRSSVVRPSLKGQARTSVIGVRCHSLTVLDDFSDGVGRKLCCKCDCGNLKVIHKSNFGRTRSCGCIRGSEMRADLVAQQGGQYIDFGAKTTILVYGGRISTKVDKARDKGVKVMSQDEFYALLKRKKLA